MGVIWASSSRNLWIRTRSGAGRESAHRLYRRSRHSRHSPQEDLLELRIIARELLVDFAQLLGLSACVQDRGMVAAAESLADLGQALLGEFLREGHRNLARARHGAEALLRIHVGDLDLEIVGHGLLDVLDGHLAVQNGEQVLEGFASGRNRDHRIVESRVGEDALERTFELANIRANMLGDEERHVLIEVHAIVLRLLEEDRHAHFQLGWLDRDRESPAEARDQALFDAGHFLREAVAGDRYLLVRLEKRVERVEELLLRPRFSDEELHVVDQEEVERTVIAL